MAEHDTRILRTKVGTVDDDYGGATLPGASDRARLYAYPVHKVYLYVVPMDASGPIDDDTDGTFTLTPIYVSDLDNDGTVDATDLAVRGERQLLATYYTLIEIPMRGRLAWSVDLRTFASNPTGLTQVRVYYLESTEGLPG